MVTPQSGFQTDFLRNSADICIGGGAAGGGKSYALILEGLRHVDNPFYRSVYFRRTIQQVKKPGGLWDTSKEIIGCLRTESGGVARSTEMPPRWLFPSGAWISFDHLQYDHDVSSWDGAQIPLICFDELIHFSSHQFWYMLGRNRTTSGIRPYVRATTNPQPYGWVKRLVSWWLYPDNYFDTSLRGYPISDRAGRVIYFFRNGDEMYIGETVDEVISQLPVELIEIVGRGLVKTLSFVPGTLDDNKILREKDPSYESNLFAQDAAHGLRLRKGRWYAEADDDVLFLPHDIEDCFSNQFVAPSGDRYLSCDVALEGSDLFVIGVWDGFRLIKIYTYEKSDGFQVLETIMNVAKIHSVPGRNIVFDSNGVGNYLSGFLRSSFDFRSQSKPLKIDGVSQNFVNLRAQCVYKLAELIKNSLLMIDSSEFRDKIVVELLPHKKKTSNNGLDVVSKEQIKGVVGHSPDFADMLLMRMVFAISNTKKSYLSQSDNEKTT